MWDGPSQQIVLHDKLRSAYKMEKYVKHMMQVQNQMQKFHFSGKPKCMTTTEQVAFFHVPDLRKSLNFIPEDHVKELHELQKEFSINYVTLMVHVPTCTTCLAHEKQSFYLCFLTSRNPWCEILPECCFTQHCWQGTFFHKTSGCIFPISNILQNNAKLLVQHTNTARAAITRTPQLIKFQHLANSIFLSSITHCIRRVTKLRSVLLVCEVVRNTSKSSLYFMPADIYYTVDQRLYLVVCVCMYICVCIQHTHTHTQRF